MTASLRIVSPDAARLRLDLNRDGQADASVSTTDRYTADEATYKALLSRGVLLAEVEIERLFIAWVELSSTRTDNWGTWFDPLSLSNFAKDVRRGSGLPLKQQHMRSFGMGKLFDSALESMPANDPDLVEQRGAKIPLARSFAGPQSRLLERFVILRGIPVFTSPMVLTDTIIDNILATNIEQVSMGATIDPVRAPGGDLICDICGQSMIRSHGECQHMPRVVYELETGPVVATARYTRARQREGSFVDEGATPSASFLSDRAARLIADRALSLDDARGLEEVYRAHIDGVPRQAISTGATVRPAGLPLDDRTAGNDDTEGGGGMAANANPSAGVQEPRRAVVAWLDEQEDGLSAVLSTFARDADPWESAARALAAELKQAKVANGNAEARVDRFKLVLMRRWGVESPKVEDFDRALDEHESVLSFAESARDALAEDYRAAFVARYGNKADVEKAMARTSGWTADDFVESTALLREGDASPVTPGRTSTTAKPDKRTDVERESDDENRGESADDRRIDLSGVVGTYRSR